MKTMRDQLRYRSHHTPEPGSSVDDAVHLDEMETLLRRIQFENSVPAPMRTKSVIWQGFFSKAIDPTVVQQDSPLVPRRMVGNSDKTRNISVYSLSGPSANWASVTKKIQRGLRYEPKYDSTLRFVQSEDDALCALHTAAQVMYSCFYKQCTSEVQVSRDDDIVQGVWGQRMLDSLLVGGLSRNDFPSRQGSRILPANEPFETLYLLLYRDERLLDEKNDRGRIKRGEAPPLIAHVADDYIAMSFKYIFVAFFNLFTTHVMHTSVIDDRHLRNDQENEYEMSEGVKYVMVNRPGPITKTDSIHYKLNDIKFENYVITRHVATVLRVQHDDLSHFISYCRTETGPLWFDPSPNTLAGDIGIVRYDYMAHFDTIEDVYYVLMVQRKPSPPR